MNGDVAIILPAAGSGSRFGARENKIFQTLRDQAVFLHTIDRFAQRNDVCQILLVVSQDDHDRISQAYGDQLKERNVELVIGGPTRSVSVRNALARLCDQARLVAVHDAVRPCLLDQWIDAVFAKARESGGAILAYPLHGTIKRTVADTDVIDTTVCRQDLWEAQTPQVFQRDILQKAYATDSNATDDAELVQQMGKQVHVVEGDPRNIKITKPSDLILAEAIWPTLTQERHDED